MKELTYYKKCLNFLITVVLIALFVFGNGRLFRFYYILLFIFMIGRTLRISTKKRIKAYLILCYFVMLLAQREFSLWEPPADTYLHIAYNFICTVTLCLPMIIEKIVTVKKYIDFRFPSINEIYTLSFSEVKNNMNKILQAAEYIKSSKSKLTAENIQEILKDWPRNKSFVYTTNESLNEFYFEEAEKTLNDPRIYIIISDTGSPASEVFSVFTQRQFNHSSIAFDRDLKTIVSYNNGEKIYPPGLNLEMVELFRKKADAKILVYSLECTIEQKKIIIEKIRQINKEGSAYNALGLVLKQSFKPNIMFCSQFVYTMLKLADLSYFENNSLSVKPTDFVEKDYYRKLKYEYEIKFE